ncbi:conserved Plasmodium protein, unknown function [Plasmodium gallinaceum]|uniref:Uncharacterized protein n=1 Tax=Plasmodium gallinaceum TaxID=5849 RepID=A0A1J1GWN7_PLAGA|nr:conserved Plasmodium protein, unknown function [Plasmodium gallinaceum]CRG96887.1 conserved Plasmodium protein, unknown function [Plasmodium gallinaceum]
MDEKHFIQTFENINEDSIPSPLIKHSSECKNYNHKKNKNIDGFILESSHKTNGMKKDEDKKYFCININKFNGKCYHKKISIIDQTHLHLTLGESLIYILNIYLQKKIISKCLYNRILYSFQLAIIEILSEVKESKENKWNIKGKLINSKKENNTQLFYLENAFLSLKNIILHVPLLKIKSIDI